MVFDNLIIRARSLEKTYGNEAVLTDFNLDVWKGSIFGILGVSGSGKTTGSKLITTTLFVKTGSTVVLIVYTVAGTG